MRGVHRELEEVKGMQDPLDEVAKRQGPAGRRPDPGPDPAHPVGLRLPGGASVGAPPRAQLRRTAQVPAGGQRPRDEQ
ncbi:hypothetical protein G6F66_015340 [Rhizopus arrhizus]|nr:hypothetical protein G6F66_015340 [Rhizopus arrhizus]